MLHKLSLDASRCLQIDFHLVSEYCQTTSTRDVGLSKQYGAAHAIKMPCVQQGFPSKPFKGCALLIH